MKAGGVGLNRITRWVESGGNLEWTASNGWTLLHFAAENGNEALVRLLIRHGANVDARDNRGATPLMLACDSGYLGRTKNSSVVLLLLDSGADPNARDSDGKTAFGLVRRSRDDEDRKIAELLMDRTKLVAGSDIDCPECGAPTSREMAKRDVRVTFNGVFVDFSCQACSAKQRIPLNSITKSAGVRVKCPCGAIAWLPPSIWCRTCGKGLSTGWQQSMVLVPGDSVFGASSRPEPTAPVADKGLVSRPTSKSTEPTEGKSIVDDVKDILIKASGAREFVIKINSIGFRVVKEDFTGLHMQKGDTNLILSVLPSRGPDLIWCLSMIPTKGSGIVNLVDEGRRTF